MARNFYINTDALSPKAAMVRSQTQQVPATTLEFVLGDIQSVNLYLVNTIANVPGYDPTSGFAGYTVKVGLGTAGGLPTSGTFRLTFSGHTTTALDYQSTSAQIQAALEALTNIGVGNIVVTGSFPVWMAQFVGTLGDADQPLMTGDSTLLSPASSVDVQAVVNGSGVQNEIQAIEISLQPVSLQTAWTAIANGWNATLDFSKPAIAQLFVARQNVITPTFEVRVTGPDGNPLTVANPDVRIWHRVIDETSTASAPVTNAASGSFPIPSGADTGQVTGLTLGSVPRQVFLTVLKPAGADVIHADPVAGSITTAGFKFDLDGVTPSAGYVLYYDLRF